MTFCKHFLKYLGQLFNLRLFWMNAMGIEPTNTSFVKASLAKWLSVRLRNKWLWVLFPLQSLNFYISRVSSMEFLDIQAISVNLL